MPFGVLGALGENHWHWVFVFLAAPISLLAAYRSHRAGAPPAFIYAVALGLALLVAGILVPTHDLQVGLTVAGAVVLATAHISNLRRLSAPHPS